MMETASHRHHDLYADIGEWSDDKLVATYRRLSRDLRRRGYDDETVARMFTVEERMRERDLDPQAHARDVENELQAE